MFCFPHIMLQPPYCFLTDIWLNLLNCSRFLFETAFQHPLIIHWKLKHSVCWWKSVLLFKPKRVIQCVSWQIYALLEVVLGLIIDKCLHSFFASWFKLVTQASRFQLKNNHTSCACNEDRWFYGSYDLPIMGIWVGLWFDTSTFLYKG